MRRPLVSALVALVILAMLAPVTAAATTWTARLGYYGVATIKVGSPDRISINAKHFRTRTAYPISLRKGTCAKLGTLVYATRLTTSTTGTIVRTLTMTSAQTRAARLPLSIRIGTKCGSFTAPAPTPTPAPLPTPTPQASPTPTPSPTPPTGGTLYVGVGFMLVIPQGWTYVPSSSLTEQDFDGPGLQGIGVVSIPSSLSLDGLATEILGSIKTQTGADPERIEDITLHGAPGKLATFHVVQNGVNVHLLDAFTVSNGRAFEIAYANVAGTEAADRTLMLGVLSTFMFTTGMF